MPEILLEMDAVVARAADPPQRDPGGGINGAGATVGTASVESTRVGEPFPLVTSNSRHANIKSDRPIYVESTPRCVRERTNNSLSLWPNDASELSIEGESHVHRRHTRNHSCHCLDRQPCVYSLRGSFKQLYWSIFNEH